MPTVPKLTPNSITALTYIGGDVDGWHPVYRVTLNGNQSIVVKAERIGIPTGSPSIKWAAKLMKNVSDTEVNVKVLEPVEVVEFKRAALAFPVPDPPAQNQARLLYLLNEDKKAYIWVRMPFIQGLSDSKLPKNNGATAADVLYGKMNNDSFWTELGKLLAVDLFIGNFDRFKPNGLLHNEANVFFRETGPNQHKAIGLDFLEIASYQKGTADLTRFETTDNFNHLRVLVDEELRKTYATNVRDSLRDYLLSRNAQGIYALGGITKLCEGIVEGAAAIKNYLRQKLQQQGGGRQRHVGGLVGVQQQPPPPPPPPQQNPPPQQQVQRQRGGNVIAPPQVNNPPPLRKYGNNRLIDPNEIPEGIRQRMVFLGW